MDERRRFIEDHARALYEMTELCARYGISRKTGYKWLARFEAHGRPGLVDRSHAPHACPHRIPREVAQRIVAARRAHPTWGPRKLLDWLGLSPGPRSSRYQRSVPRVISWRGGGW